MRILFYLLDGRSNASSWHRALQFFPLLRQHGIEARAALPVPDHLYQRLVEQGDGRLTSKLLFYNLFLAARLCDVVSAGRFDVVVIQRDLFPFGPPLLERLLRARNPAIVYDTDDATYERPVFTPSTPFQRWRRFDKVVEVVRQARAVSVATEPLAAWARRYTDRVSVVPMALDLRRYAPLRRCAPVSEPVVIGWMGTGGGIRYLEALAPVLRDLARSVPIRVRVVSGAADAVTLTGVPVDRRRWHPRTALADAASFDVGLVPLADTPFERAKFPFKLLQYQALGVPSVCARVGAAATLVEEGHTALLAESPEEWRTQLERIIRDTPLRRALRATALATIEQRYTIERVEPLLEIVLRSARSATSV
jgi:glycosyltransferase involved in cell wall biosynthesis